MTSQVPPFVQVLVRCVAAFVFMSEEGLAPEMSHGGKKCSGALVGISVQTLFIHFSHVFLFST